jgi:hypothetical protein
VFMQGGLVEFFEGKQRHPTDVPASNFTDQPFVYTRDDVVADLCRKINKQIAHITYERTVDPVTMMNGADCEALYRAVTKVVERYYRCVKPEYRALWPALVQPPFFDPPIATHLESFTTGTAGQAIGYSALIARST